MNDYQRHVIQVKYLLDADIGELMKFFNTADFAKLGRLEKERLLRQRRIMIEYTNVLAERIAAFGIEDEE